LRPVARRLLALSLVALAVVSVGPATMASGAQSITTVLNILYAQPGGEPLYLDAYLPPGRGPFPAVITIHGGGWSGGTKNWMRGISLRLAEAGLAAFAIDYRVGPAHLFPAPVDDVRSAVDWVRANASTYHVDASHLSALGTSAGATLALLAGATGSEFKAVASWSGPTDLVALRFSKDPEIILGLLNFVGTTNASALAQASPITYVHTPAPPTYLAHSTQEFVPFSQATRMYDLLQGLGIPTHLLRVEGNHHGTELLPWAMDPTIAFLKAWG
jgi:acetyl esterase